MSRTWEQCSRGKVDLQRLVGSGLYELEQRLDDLGRMLPRFVLSELDLEEMRPQVGLALAVVVGAQAWWRPSRDIGIVYYRPGDSGEPDRSASCSDSEEDRGSIIPDAPE